MTRTVAMATVALAGTVLAACTHGSGGVSGPPLEKPGPRVLYVAIGASETVGVGTTDPLRQAWTQVLFRTAFPRSAVFVNLGASGATVADALEEEAPEATALAPDVVTVWLNVNDLIAGVPTATYQAELDRLVSLLRGAGSTRVLVANVPPLDQLPAYLACQPFAPTPDGCDSTRRLPPAVVDQAVADYNMAIAAVAQKDGATLVDLHAVVMAARAGGTEAQLVSADGFHPSTVGARVIAQAFTDALKRVWPNLAG